MSESFGGGSTSVDNGIVRVTVEWSQIGNPVEDIDFTADFAQPLNPAIELLEGDLGWIVSSELVSNSNPANIGSLTTPDAENYSVNIIKAQDAGSLTFQPAGDHYSSLTGGIDGDLTSQLTLQLEAAEGGAVHFDIFGNVPGNITIPSTPNGGRLSILGDFSGHIDIQTMRSFTLSMMKTSGSIDIGSMEGSFLFQFDQVTSTAVITIGNMSSVGATPSEALFTLTSGGFDFDGRLVLENCVPENQQVIVHGPLTTGATIDLTDGDVAGIFQVWGGGGGDILNGGAVTDTGGVLLTGGDLTARTFSGSASFASVSTRGTIELQDSGNLAGSLTIGGAMDGKISIEGEMQTGAMLSVTGDVSDDITVGGDMDGAISMGGALAGSAQVVIRGLCDGPMTIGKETGALSLIRAEDGLGINGSITINDSRGNFDANGDIYLGRPGGQTPPFPVVFDGSILIKDALGGGDGDLNGRIKIFACHSTTDDMDICICGSINGLVGINQTGCPNQVGWSCVSGCP